MSGNIFDKMTILPSSVGNMMEETLYEDTGIDNQKVIHNVMNSLGTKSHNRKPRILRKLLIAAAVCVLLIGVVSIPIVAENLNILYGNIFGGDKYTADFESISNAQVKISDPNLQLDKLSVSGNGDMDDLIDIRLSKKNGDRFTYNEFNIVKRGNVTARIEDWDDPDREHRHDLEVVIGKENNAGIPDSLNGLGHTSFYGLEDNGKTLRILIDLQPYGDSLQDRKISIKSYSYLLASIENTLGKFDSMDHECLESARKLQNENAPAFSYDLWTNSYYYSDILYHDNSFDVISGRIKTVSLPFEITFTMNDEKKGNSYSVSSELLTKAFHVETECGKLSVSPLGIILSAKTKEKVALPDMDKCYIITSSGEKYYLIANGCTYGEKSVMMNCIFRSIPESMGGLFDNQLYLIDPHHIKEIVINGIIVSEAPSNGQTIP